MVIVEENGGAGLLVVVLVTGVEDLDAHLLAWLGLARGNPITNTKVR